VHEELVASVPSNASSGPITVVVNSISAGRPGSVVVLTGTGFSAAQFFGRRVTFSGKSGDVIDWSGTSITVGAPWKVFVESEGDFIASQQVNGNRGELFKKSTSEGLCKARLNHLTEYAGRLIEVRS
jgi:hypothetical protein